MHVQIIVSDSEGASGAPAVTMLGAAHAAHQAPMPQASGAPDFAAAPAPGAATPPAEILRAAAALGAINGGPAPNFGNMGQAGIPPAFVTGNNASTPGSQGGMGGTDVAAGAAPGSGAQMETYTAPEPGGDE
jgi:hypothetical protein